MIATPMIPVLAGEALTSHRVPRYVLRELAEKDSNQVSCRSISTHKAFKTLKAYMSNLVQPQCEIDIEQVIHSAS